MKDKLNGGIETIVATVIITGVVIALIVATVIPIARKGENVADEGVNRLTTLGDAIKP